MIVLKPIDGYNYLKITNLKVRDDQQEFVTPNVYSLAQAYAMPECRPLAVYEGANPVGFVMYALDADDREYWIYRLMIDERYQGRGYGREAMGLLLRRIAQEDHTRHMVYISFAPENSAARRLYSSLGFAPDGRVVDGEIVFRLQY